MKRLSFAMYDEQNYMRALADYLGRKSFLLENRLFTTRESLCRFLKEHSVDVLLLGQDVETDFLTKQLQVGRVIILSEADMVEEGQGYPVIFKYQSAEKILQEIFQIVGQRETEMTVPIWDSASSTEFLGIYRPYGEAFGLHWIFSGEEKPEQKNLLVNMELLSGLSVPEGVGSPEGIKGMSELIYYLKQPGEKLSLKLRPLIRQWEGVDYLFPVEDYRDLYSINREDVDRFLSVLIRETDYDRVIFDIGFLTDASLYLLYCCDKIYMPRTSSTWEENQKHALELLLMREGLGEMLERIQYVSPSPPNESMRD